jgi:large conductance mechanosensitive channel
MKKILDEYKEFALKGNVMDMAIGIVIGGAFATIASSLVANIIAPIIGLLSSGVDTVDLFLVLKEGAVGTPYLSLDQANKDGAVTLSYGLFINSVFSFFIVSWITFILIKAINRINRKEERDIFNKTKDCPMCFSEIHKKARICPNCTSKIETIT